MQYFWMHSNSCSATECVSGDCSSEVKQENLSVVKEEPDDVCCVICVILYLTRNVGQCPT